ncbi:MAG: HEPN domain-containing protein [Bryobacterales bacterium]|nr:HEPN domain-containing protein [Bryobacterales bacterium]
MNPNELLARETRAWLAKAFDDLKSARVLANAGLEGTALYHCQQSAEKRLKAFLTWHNQPFRKTHNLKELGNLAIGLIPRSRRRPRTRMP